VPEIASNKPKPFDLAGIPFVPARNYTRAARQAVDVLVLHSMESGEKPGTALRVAEWFAGETAPRASAHYCVDDTQVIRCVRDHDIAWCAPGANANGIHIELAGRAAQTSEQWADGFSMAVLERAIRLSAALCRKWEIPPLLLTPLALKHGQHGITTHHSVTLAFRKSTHTDPGPNFPLMWFVDRVREELNA
jgi:N-acetyl-anhydromuramyl-L-alanine amidase AmpD